ncbi:MAG: antitoxin Xre/MbcA/ParS toxin-binding domain-containing protein [Alphaproteobacteria bacterium]|nr:antitoxin Xre/MbcA/ParS toxin-binding domain-containing protein [Alphaproteobacteria bacterium]
MLIQAVARAWSLSDEELAKLLAYGRASTIRDVLNGTRTFLGTEDQFDRARQIFKIHSLLAELFVDPSQEEVWIRRPFSAFSGVSPLNHMLNNRIPGMVQVLHYLETYVANPR